MKYEELANICREDPETFKVAFTLFAGVVLRADRTGFGVGQPIDIAHIHIESVKLLSLRISRRSQC